MVFFFNFLGTQVQILPKKVNSSTPFNTHATPLRGPLWSSWTTLGGWGAEESGGNWLKMQINSKNALLLHRKNEKFHFFKKPSFKFENLIAPMCGNGKQVSGAVNFFFLLKYLWWTLCLGEQGMFVLLPGFPERRCYHQRHPWTWEKIPNDGIPMFLSSGRGPFK